MRFLASILIVTPIIGDVPDSSTYKCPEAIHAAVTAGWQIKHLDTLDSIVWAESRCQPDVVGTGAVGLTQIQWSAHKHWIEQLGYSRHDLFDPVTNMRVALTLAHYSQIQHGCMFQPWYMSGNWCV